MAKNSKSKGAGGTKNGGGAKKGWGGKEGARLFKEKTAAECLVADITRSEDGKFTAAGGVDQTAVAQALLGAFVTAFNDPPAKAKYFGPKWLKDPRQSLENAVDALKLGSVNSKDVIDAYVVKFNSFRKTDLRKLDKAANPDAFKGVYDKNNEKAKEQGYEGVYDKNNKKAKEQGYEGLHDKETKKAKEQGYEGSYDKKNKKAKEQGYEGEYDKKNKKAKEQGNEGEDDKYCKRCQELVRPVLQQLKEAPSTSIAQVQRQAQVLRSVAPAVATLKQHTASAVHTVRENQQTLLLSHANNCTEPELLALSGPAATAVVGLQQIEKATVEAAQRVALHGAARGAKRRR
jgi:hypothetical protein